MWPQQTGLSEISEACIRTAASLRKPQLAAPQGQSGFHIRMPISPAQTQNPLLGKCKIGLLRPASKINEILKFCH